MEKTVNEVVEEFGDFLEGTRVLFLIHRSKEGGTNKGTKMYKEISNNPDEFKDKLEYLYERAEIEGITPLRIYSSVNNRDTLKAIRNFKQKQLDADYDGADVKSGFYTDVKNRFLSALMKPSSRKSKYFLIDIDDSSQLQNVLSFLSYNEIKFVKSYETVSGVHIICEPFNPKLLEEQNFNEVSIHKDGLLLLTYNK